MSSRIIKKLKNQLWYLGEELAGLALFDERIPVEEKKKMAANIQTVDANPTADDKKKVEYRSQKSISDFVNKTGLDMFNALGIDRNFLKADPSLWSVKENFTDALKTVKSLKSVNDTAERAVGLVTRVQSSCLKYKSPEMVEKTVFNIEKDMKKKNKNCNKY